MADWAVPLVAGLAGLLPASAAAATVEVRDLRASGFFLIADLASSDSAGAASQTVAYGSAISYVRGDLGRWGGLVYGGQVGVVQDHYSYNGRYATLESECAKGWLGWGWSPVHQWHAELTPEAGIGYLFQTYDENGQTVHGRGRAFIWGGRFGVFYTIHHLQIGLEAMHERLHGHLLADVIGANGLNRRASRTVTIDGSGLALDLGLRF
jgi:hypothetical protein